MTEAIGSQLGAEIEAGGRAGLGLSPVAARFGKGPGDGLFTLASGNLTTGLASGPPSFRSSWQSVMNAWRGVSPGTNGVESEEAGEPGTTGAANAAVSGLSAKTGKTTQSSARAGFSVASKLTATSQNVLPTAPANQDEVLSHTSRPVWNAAQNADAQASPTAGADATANDRPSATRRDHVAAAAEHDNQENTRQVVIAGAQIVAPTIEAPILFPVSPASSQTSTQTETTSVPQMSSSTSELSGLNSTQASVRAASAGVGTRNLHVAPAPIPRGRAQGNLTHETAVVSLDDTSDSTASRRVTSLSSSEALSIDTQHEPSSAGIAAAGKSLSGQPVTASKEDSFTNPGLAESDSDSSTLLAAISGTAQSNAGAVETGLKQTVERSSSRTATHGTAGETVAAATSTVAVQTATVDVASAGLRNPAAAQVSAASASGHAQISSATAAATSAQNTFSALDQGTSLGTPTWTHAGGQHAEAGFRDPDLGWVGVRADLSASGIHATLVPNSAEAAQALNGHLAGLSTHLVDQQASVVSLSMASPGDSGIENGTGQHMQQGAQESPQGSASEESQTSSQRNTPPASTTSDLAVPAQNGILDTSTYAGNLRGTRISVMA